MARAGVMETPVMLGARLPTSTEALALAVALEAADGLEEGLGAWERAERPLTEHTQNIAHRYMADAHTGVGGGTLWDNGALRTACHTPTGCG